jgi:hypothetical protein
VGLATNGALTGRDSGLVPVAGTSQQLSQILEALARMRMETKGDLIDSVLMGADLPWGLSSVYLSLLADQRLTDIKQYLLQRRIPMLAFVCRTKDQGSAKIARNLNQLYLSCPSSQKPEFRSQNEETSNKI